MTLVTQSGFHNDALMFENKLILCPDKPSMAQYCNTPCIGEVPKSNMASISYLVISNLLPHSNRKTKGIVTI